MIPETTIQRIAEQPISSYIASVIELKKSGANHTACCPFHGEKTASLMVNDAKNIFKCFGCGKGGNLFTFIMELNNVTFPDAVKIAAKHFNIEIKEEQLTDEQISERKEFENKRSAIVQVNNWAQQHFSTNLWGTNVGKEAAKVKEYLLSRINDEEIWYIWGAGLAMPGWCTIVKAAGEVKLKEELCLAANIIKQREDGTLYDKFVSRITLPIHDANGLLVAFTARDVAKVIGAENADDKKIAKYINSDETLLYQKRKILFGMWRAAKAIRETKCAYIVEGNIDVIKLHYLGIENTVATGGTELTDDQIAILKRHTKNITLIGDGDKAGQRAVIKNGCKLLVEGFSVSVIPLPADGEKTDPDSFFHSTEQFTNYQDTTRTEFFQWYTEYLLSKADGDLQRANAIQTVCEFIATIPNEMHRLIYIDSFAKKCKQPKKFIREAIDNILREQVTVVTPVDADVPDHVNIEDVKRWGFYEDNNQYWFLTKDGHMPGSNFTLTPLFHIYSKSDNKRLIELCNEHNYRRTVDIPSKSFISFEQFQQAAYQEGNYIFYGTKQQFMKVLSKISNEFPVCEELKTLGWQREGFFAFSNGIFNGEYVPVDRYGMCEHNGKKYFSPAYSVVYSDVREDDDEYENDRFFKYQKSPIQFAEWAELMMKVYEGEKGMIALAFLLASMFRDVIYERYKIFPHLFLFGEKQSGKSQLGWSLQNVFLNGQPPFNLSSGTNVGFFRKLARFRNSCVWYDEYTNDVDDKRFQALKAAYDGVGHEKGKMTKDNRTEVTKVVSACIISGQYLPTRDDNALYTRSIMLNFSQPAEGYTSQQTNMYNMLKNYEQQGLSSIVTEMLVCRGAIEKNFGQTFYDLFERIKSELVNEEKQFEERLVRNFVTIMAPVEIIIKNNLLKLPFKFNELYQCAKEMIADMSMKISSSEALGTFWKLVEFMFESNVIKYGEDFKIVKQGAYCEFKIEKHGKLEPYTFNNETELLYIRFTKIHPLYLEAHRKQYGVNGIDITSLNHYMHTSRAFVGLCRSARFLNQNSSSYIFDYTMMETIMHVNLKRDSNEEINNKIENDEYFKPDENAKQF